MRYVFHMALPIIGRLHWLFTRIPIYKAINNLSEAAEARLAAVESAASDAQDDIDNIADGSTIYVQEFNPAPAATNNAALKAATATTVADQTILAAALISGGKTALLTYPRIVTFTVAGTAANGPTSADVVGTDYDDAPLTETVSITQSAGTYPSVKAFKTIVSYTLKGATDTDATVAAGIGSTFGLNKTIKNRADRHAVIQEVYSASGTGAVVTNGVIVAPATCAPHGGYTPNSAPDGTRKYSLTYEQALS